MKKKIVIFLLLLIISSMPFLNVSCVNVEYYQDPEEKEDAKKELLQLGLLDKSPHKILESSEQDEHQFRANCYFGYELGFPISLAQIDLKPFTIQQVYPLGLLNYVFLLIVFCGYSMFIKKDIKVLPAFNFGLKCTLFYIIIHFIYNLFYPIYFIYIQKAKELTRSSFFLGGRIAEILIAPYAHFIEGGAFSSFSLRTGGGGIIMGPERMTVASQVGLRINFIGSCILYFLIGALIYSLIRLIKSPQKNILTDEKMGDI